jgi:signal recognition particle subunit SRP54
MLKQAIQAMRGKDMPGMGADGQIDPSQIDTRQLESTARKMGMGGLGGMGGGMPGLGGLPNMFGKKK